MVLLPDLPSDELSMITYLVSAYDIGNLWFCGSQLLNWKLSKAGGVTSFFFHQDSYHSALWPQLASHLEHLSLFSVTIRNYDGNFPEYQPDISSIPRNVKKLVLNISDSYFCFQTALRDHPDKFKNLESISLGGNEAEFLPLWEESRLPALTSLLISFSFSSPTTLDIRTIPRSLTKLSLFEFKTLQENLDIRFSNSLTDLSLQLGSCWDFLHLLPENLLSFKCNIDEVGPDFLNYNWKCLPSSLTELELSMEVCSLDFIESLPPNLTSFATTGLKLPNTSSTATMIRALPRSLTKFQTRFETPVSSDIVAALPRGLRRIPRGENAWESAHLLPPTTTSANLARISDTPIDSSLVLSLPPSLLDFTIDDLTPSIAKLIPPKVTTIMLSNGPLEAETVKNLPPSLTSLFIVFKQPLVEAESLMDLPRQMKILDILPSSYGLDDGLAEVVPIIIPTASALWLPPALVELTLGIIEVKGSEWYSLLPATLNLLKLGVVDLPKKALLKIPCRKNLNALELRTRVAPRHGWSTFIKTLPPNLTEVTFETRNHNTDLTDDDLRNLPRPLTSMDFPLSPSVKGTCADDLPPYIRSFYFESSIPDWFKGLKKKRRKSNKS
jgi:hypothetical protein